jgi:hypothetical protein
LHTAKSLKNIKKSYRLVFSYENKKKCFSMHFRI